MTVGSDGRMHTNGGGNALKSTQSYPNMFGFAVEAVCSAHVQEILFVASAMGQLHGQEISFAELTEGVDRWHDANLNPCFDLVMRVVSRKFGL